MANYHLFGGGLKPKVELLTDTIVRGHCITAKKPLQTSSMGGSLPVATVEIIRKTLTALAEQTDIVAILPNQKIHLIQPRRVEYSDLNKQEQQDKLTWGLKQLEIPKLWETTKGEDINVAVLDTGVYGAH